MYDNFSSDYDRFVNWPNRLAAELPFLETKIRTVGGEAARVLDAACGTGMHAIALAKKGYAVSGADLSAGMIERARANAAESGVKVEFSAAGFGDLARSFGAGRFDALLCLGNSLPHLLSPAHLSAALADFSTSLRPGGLLILQNRNFDAVMTARERWMEPQSHKEGDSEWLFLRFYDFDPDGLIQFHVVTLSRQGGESWQQQVRSTRLYPLLQDDLVNALDHAGFTMIHTYGGMNGAPFDPVSSGNLVLTAVRA